MGRDHAWRFRDYVIAAFNRDTPWRPVHWHPLIAETFLATEGSVLARLTNGVFVFGGSSSG